MTSNENTGTDDHAGGERPPHTCATCFEEFDWQPARAGGREFCCPGCAGGGPCDGTRGPGAAGAREAPTAAAGGGDPGPATPGWPARTDGLLSAVAGLPVQFRPVLTLRFRRGMAVEAIAEELRMPAVDVRSLLDEGESRLRSELGDEAVDRAWQRAAAAAVATPGAPAGGAAQESIARFVQTSLGALRPIAAAPPGLAQAEDYQATLRDALNEAASIFQAAATRLGREPAERESLRAMVADRPGGRVRVAASGVADASAYLQALRALPEVEAASIETVTGDSAAYRVEAGSIGALVRAMLSLEGPFRPASLSIGEDEIAVSLGAARERGPAAGPRFELGAEAFFGARHFVNIGGNRGPTHHHSWRVEATLVSDAEDSDGVVVGFAEARDLLEDLVAAYNETLLNNVPPFDRVQPTAENLARTIYHDFKSRFESESAHLTAVRVWESPTQHASYSEPAGSMDG